VAKRTTEWDATASSAASPRPGKPYVEWANGWLEVVPGEGRQALEHAYLDLLDGRIDPAKAHVLTLSG